MTMAKIIKIMAMMCSLSMTVTCPLGPHIHMLKAKGIFPVNTHINANTVRITLSSLYLFFLLISRIDWLHYDRKRKDDKRQCQWDDGDLNNISINQDRVTHLAPKGWWCAAVINLTSQHGKQKDRNSAQKGETEEDSTEERNRGRQHRRETQRKTAQKRETEEDSTEERNRGRHHRREKQRKTAQKRERESSENCGRQIWRNR